MRGLLGGVEAGGTKVVAAVGSGPTDIHHRARFDTTDPETTMPGVLEFFSSYGPLTALGIASFGPVELRRDHPDFGTITTTPKKGWNGFDLVGAFSSLSVPVGFVTDVVGAALGEWAAGSGRGVDNLVYITVGTGVGAGQVIEGRPVPGLVHAEMGHIPVRRLDGDDFAGNCPYHGDCLEGMISGPAIEARWGRPGAELAGSGIAVLPTLGHYLGSGLLAITYALAPQRVIVGGGVMAMPGLLEAAGDCMRAEMNGYAIQDGHRSGYLVPPGLGGDSGLAGALLLAAQALEE